MFKIAQLSLISTALIAGLFAPALALAQTANAQVIVVTQSAYGSTANSGTVSVTATGPSLSGYPSNTPTLSFSANFNGDSHVVTMVPGSYSITSSTFTNQYTTYSSECNGYLTAGQTRTCTITLNQNGSQPGNARLNVSLNVLNNNGGNRTAGDFTVSVNGTNVNTPTFLGTAGTTQVTLNNGWYLVDIQNLNGYSIMRSGDCSGTINSGDTRSCVVTLTQNGAYSYTGGTTGGTYYVNGTTCYYGANYPNGSTCYQGGGYNNGVYYVNGSTCYWGTSYTQGSNCYRGTVVYTTGTLTCAPSSQTVDNGQTVSFSAYGASGPFTWTVDGRSFFAIGSQLNTVLSGPGVHTVQVSNGLMNASCTATVSNKQYVLSGGGVVLGSSTSAPGLPNTGYAPSTVGIALALLGALVAFPLALRLSYLHAKNAARSYFGA